MGRVIALVVLAACGFDTTIPVQASMPVDAPMTTVDAPPDASPASLCTARYGTADRFDLCTATPTACQFYVHTNGSSCEALCTSLGGQCNEAYDGDCADISSTVRACTFTLGDQVCNCRP